MSGKVNLTLRLFKGNQFLREETFSQQLINVGKLSSSHLRLEDESVGRMHAVIEANTVDDVTIIDIGSPTGTFINGEKINKGRLKSGDTVTVGDIRIEVAIADAAHDAQPVMAAGAPPAMGMDRPGTPSIPAPNAGIASGFVPAQNIPAPFAGPGPAGVPGPAARAAAPLAQPFANANVVATDVDEPGAKAVEVAAMMNDSVINVKHLMNTKGGQAGSTTKAFFAISALLLVVALGSFLYAMSNARYNAAYFDEWVGVLKRPEWAYRPRMLPLYLDAAPLVGFIGGLTFAVFGLLRLRKDRQTPFFRIGDAAGVEVATNTTPGAFTLVGPAASGANDEFVFNAAPGMEGEVTIDGSITSLADALAKGRPSSSQSGATEISIPAKGRIKAKLGNITYLVTGVPKPREYPVPFLAADAGTLLGYMGGAVAAAVGIILLLGTVYDNEEDPFAEVSLDDSMTVLASNNAQDDAKAEEPPPDEKESEDESGGTGTAMALDEGKMGKKDSNKAEGQYKMAKTDEDTGLARQAAEQSAASGGAIGAAFSSAVPTSAFASITGTNDISSGLDDTDIQGGLLGNAPGEMAGGFGFGRSGYGPGGGGTGWGTIGLGNQGKMGHGSGTGSGYGTGAGRGGGSGTRARSSVVPEPRIGTPQVGGDLDAATIRRYIKRNSEKIRSCYERQLLAKPTLSGTVVAQFFISPTGQVTTSTASGLDGAVSSCLAGVIKNIEFPKPKGGGGVQVKSFPFDFRPAGG